MTPASPAPRPAAPPWECPVHPGTWVITGACIACSTGFGAAPPAGGPQEAATPGQAAHARWHAFRWPGTPALRATQAAGEWDVLSDQDRAAWEAAAEEPYKAGYAAGIAAGLDQAVAENASLRQQLLRTEEQCRRHVNQADAGAARWKDERDAAREELRQAREALAGYGGRVEFYEADRNRHRATAEEYRTTIAAVADVISAYEAETLNSFAAMEAIENLFCADPDAPANGEEHQ